MCDPGFQGLDCSVIPAQVIPLTNSIELTLVWGLHGYREDNNSAPDYDSSFDFLAATVQAWINETASLVRAEESLLARTEIPVFIEAFIQATQSSGAPFPINITSVASKMLQVFLHDRSGRAFRSHVVTEGEDFAGRVKYVRCIFKLNMAVDADKDERTKLRDRWDSWVDSWNSGAPAGAGQILALSPTWASMDLESQVLSSTIGAFALSIGSVLGAVVLFTQNIIVAIFVTFNILMVVCLIAGTILNILAFEFGVIEAIGATIFVGLGVDYCLHLAHGYNEAPGKTAKEKVTHTLIVLGPSVVGGALTTIAGCAFLLPCKLILFRKLGWFLLSNAIYSVAYTFIFLTPILFICGPTGVTGTVFCFPCLRRFAPDHLVPEEDAKSGKLTLSPVVPVEAQDVHSSDMPSPVAGIEKGGHDEEVFPPEHHLPGRVPSEPALEAQQVHSSDVQPLEAEHVHSSDVQPMEAQHELSDSEQSPEAQNVHPDDVPDQDSEQGGGPQVDNNLMGASASSLN